MPNVKTSSNIGITARRSMFCRINAAFIFCLYDCSPRFHVQRLSPISRGTKFVSLKPAGLGLKHVGGRADARAPDNYADKKKVPEGFP